MIWIVLNGGIEMGYGEIVDNASHNVIRVEETDLHVSNERQTSLLEW